MIKYLTTSQVIEIHNQLIETFGGTKGLAFTSAITFLEINGYKTRFNQAKAEKFILKLASQKVGIKEISDFLKDSTVHSWQKTKKHREE